MPITAASFRRLIHPWLDVVDFVTKVDSSNRLLTLEVFFFDLSLHHNIQSYLVETGL